MLFNSYQFLFLFLPANLLMYYGGLKLKSNQLPFFILLIASLIFYAVWQVAYLGLLFLSVLWNFSFGQFILNLRRKNKVNYSYWALLIAISGNLALLGYFKYTNFILLNLQRLFQVHWHIAEIVLPLGISFYTFTQIAYLVDAYREKIDDHSLFKYILFVTFFPHLIAGPILHHKDMIAQFSWKHLSSSRIIVNIYTGTLIFLLGLYKKVGVADPLSIIANAGFEHASSLHCVDAWLTSISYTFQLFFDFSGYSDMAVGLGLIMQIRLPINFNTPYLAINIQDFWRRWHITLSNFLRDYLYIPLGGNKKSELITYRNLLITFLLGGLWHGAGWTFIIWGFLHGIGLVTYRYWSKLNITLPKLLSIFLTFLFVNCAWVYFRANDVHQAHQILHAMLNFNDFYQPISWFNFHEILNQYRMDGQIPLISSSEMAWTLSCFSGLFLIYFIFNNVHTMAEKIRPNILNGFLFGILTLIILLKLNRTTQFLYFDF